MKKLLSLLTVMILLCSCAAAETADTYIGIWELTGATVSGEDYTAADLEMFMTIALGNYGSCTMTNDGVVDEGSWVLDGSTVLATDSFGTTLALDYADGVLSGGMDGVILHFAPAVLGGWVLYSAMDADGNVYTSEQMGVNASMTLFDDQRAIMTDDESTVLASWAMNKDIVAIATTDGEVVYFAFTTVTYDDGTITKVLCTAKDGVYLYFLPVPQ